MDWLSFAVGFLSSFGLLGMLAFVATLRTVLKNQKTEK